MSSLEERCPDDVLEQDWDGAIFLTRNAIHNCLAVREFLIKRDGVEDEFFQFADELERRAQGDVGPDFFEHFWDEVERLSVFGKRYSEAYRPVKEGRFVVDEVFGR